MMTASPYDEPAPWIRLLPMVGAAAIGLGLPLGIVLGEASIAYHSCIVGAMLIVAGRNGGRF